MKWLDISLSDSENRITRFPFGVYDADVKFYDNEDENILEVNFSAEVFDHQKLKNIEEKIRT